MTAANAFSNYFVSLATDTVTIRTAASKNNYNEPSYAGAGIAYKARVQSVSQIGATLEQEPITINYKVYILSTTLTVSPSDEITMPDGKIRPIVSIDARKDEYGQQAVVLSVG